VSRPTQGARAHRPYLKSPSTTRNARRLALTASLLSVSAERWNRGCESGAPHPPIQGARASRPYRTTRVLRARALLGGGILSGRRRWSCTALRRPPDYFEERPQQCLMYIRLSPRFDASFRRASEWVRLMSRKVASQRRDALPSF